MFTPSEAYSGHEGCNGRATAISLAKIVLAGTKCKTTHILHWVIRVVREYGGVSSDESGSRESVGVSAGTWSVQYSDC